MEKRSTGGPKGAKELRKGVNKRSKGWQEGVTKVERFSKTGSNRHGVKMASEGSTVNTSPDPISRDPKKVVKRRSNERQQGVKRRGERKRGCQNKVEPVLKEGQKDVKKPSFQKSQLATPTSLHPSPSKQCNRVQTPGAQKAVKRVPRGCQRTVERRSKKGVKRKDETV